MDRSSNATTTRARAKAGYSDVWADPYYQHQQPPADVKDTFRPLLPTTVRLYWHADCVGFRNIPQMRYAFTLNWQ